MAFYRKNMGGAQQVVRVAVGAFVAVLAATQLAGPLAWAAGAAGVVFACSGFVGYCPICAVAGIGTRREMGR